MSDRFMFRARLGAPPAVVYRALTGADALQTWFAEHAAVSLPDGRYQFWGRYTPGQLGRQRLLAAEPDRLLRFEWILDGEQTVAELLLDADESGGTILTVSQTGVPMWDELLAGATDRAALHTFWGLSIANLADHLDGRELTPMCDYGAAGTELRAEITIDAPPDAVFASIIEPEQFRRWFGVNVSIEPRVGGRLSFGTFDPGDEPAVILELEPGRTLAHSWNSGGQSLVVRWELAGSGGKTHLTFVESGFTPDRPRVIGEWAGWLSGLAELRRMHELGPAWRPLVVDYELPDMPAGALADPG